MVTESFLTLPQLELPSKGGSITVTAPSNIALVKYWGKSQGQIPRNASISFTLSNCFTKTTLGFTPFSEQSKAGQEMVNDFDDSNFEVFVDGLSKPDFAPKIATFFNRIEAYLPWIRSFQWSIDTENTFPHGSGIASSASGFAALAGALMELENSWSLDPLPPELWAQKTSFLARLGSGSASRSVLGPLMYWGTHPALAASSDLFACILDQGVHAVFIDYKDTILLVDQGEKEVSSTLGHNLMHDHPFANQRFDQAQDNLGKLLAVLACGDTHEFCRIVETEALSLHAMMMTSNPSYLLMKPNTLAIIEKVRIFRRANNVPVCFTLDAGANVHLLYPAKFSPQVMPWIQNELSGHCQAGQFIEDQVGQGVKKV
jgi:diphosphomevalonate decarboxylase